MAEKFKACLVDNCNRSAHGSAKGAKGYCRMHWGRMQRHGSPTAGRVANGETLKWLLANVEYSGDECLLWPFLRNADGYGRVRYKGKIEIASRVMCKEAHGEPHSMHFDAAHSCGNGAAGCVAQKHLSWKTRSENNMDKVATGTSGRGDDHHFVILTAEQVFEIRRLEGVSSVREIARLFGVTTGAIKSIFSGNSWQWLNEDTSPMGEVMRDESRILDYTHPSIQKENEYDRVQ